MWPTPAPGPSVKRREKPFSARNRWFSLFGSIATPPTYRVGTPARSRFFHAHVFVAASNVPTPAPRAKPALLQPPHHAAIAVLPVYAIAVVTRTALPQEWTAFHSLPERIPKPLSWYQIVAPPASHCFVFVALPTNGAMKRALTSGGLMLYVVVCE